MSDNDTHVPETTTAAFECDLCVAPFEEVIERSWPTPTRCNACRELGHTPPKCPTADCGGRLRGNGHGRFECDWCDAVFEVRVVRALSTPPAPTDAEVSPARSDMEALAAACRLVAERGGGGGWLTSTTVAALQHRAEHLTELVTQLRAAPAEEPKAKATLCLWSRADEESDLWEGTCGVAWCLNDGTPDENWVNFCPRCGKPVEEAPAEEPRLPKIEDAMGDRWVCEQHPELEWPHGDCGGPGMPAPAPQRVVVDELGSGWKHVHTAPAEEPKAKPVEQDTTDHGMDAADRLDALRENRKLVRAMPQWKRDAHAELRPKAQAAESSAPPAASEADDFDHAALELFDSKRPGTPWTEMAAILLRARFGECVEALERILAVPVHPDPDYSKRVARSALSSLRARREQGA